MMPGPINPFAGRPSTGGGDGGGYELCPAETYPATLIAIIDLGTHDDEYKGKPNPDQRAFVLAWELDEYKKNGDPFVLAQRYTVFIADDGVPTFSAKNQLRLMLESWRGKKYEKEDLVDPMVFLGKACMLNVTHSPSKKDKDKVYHNVGGVTKLHKSVQPPKPKHTPIAFHVSMGTPPNLDHLPYVYGGTPKSMQPIADIIAQSKEARGIPIGNQDDEFSEKIDPSLPTPVQPSEDDDPLPWD